MKKSLILFGIFLVLFLSGSAFIQEIVPQSDVEDQSDLVVPKVISLPACAFRPEDSEYYVTRTFYLYPWSAYFTSSGVVRQNIYAPVYLPNQVNVKKLAVYFIDNHSDDFMHFCLKRYRLTTGDVDTMCCLSSNLLSPSSDIRILKDDNISYPLVQNHYYSYYLWVEFWGATASCTFNGAKIVYE